MRQILIRLIILCCVAPLVGCGNTGDLVLPDTYFPMQGTFVLP